MSIIGKILLWTIAVVFVAGVVLGIYLGVHLGPAAGASAALATVGGWWSACPRHGG